MSAASSAAIAAVRDNAGRALTASTQVLVKEAGACAILGGGPNTPLHRATLWRGIAAGRYPKPLRVSKGLNRWVVEELLAALVRAAAERDTAD